MFCIIGNFSKDHSVLYVLKSLDRKLVSNMHHRDHLRIFRLQEINLRPAHDKLLVIIRNLRFQRKEDLNGKVVCKIHIRFC